jgi:prepilin-type processing-associated H-X9-DG protein
LLQYCQDYDEDMPTTGWDNGGGWAWRVYPYIKSTRVFVCPDDVPNASMSYMLNRDLVSGFGNQYNNISSWASPSRTMAIAEMVGHTFPTDVTQQEWTSPFMYPDDPRPSGWDYPGQGKSATGALGGRPFDSWGQDAPTGRHTDGSNFVLCDGHSKWIRGENVSDGGDIPLLSTCNQDNTPAVTGCANPGSRGSMAGTEGTINGRQFVATTSPI